MEMQGEALRVSIKSVTQKPIKFIGVGEKLDALEVFHPDRMASRILGMGDVLTLIEKAESVFDEEKAKELEKKIRKGFLYLGGFSRSTPTGSKDGLSGIDLGNDSRSFKKDERDGRRRF